MSKLHGCVNQCCLLMLTASGCAVSVVRSASFVLPPALQRLVEDEGMELGAADDVLFGKRDSRSGLGTVSSFIHYSDTLWKLNESAGSTSSHFIMEAMA